MNDPSRRISSSVGWSAIALTILGVNMILLIGVALSSNIKRECSDESGKVVCETVFEFKGWAGVPLQAIGLAVGGGMGVFRLVQSGNFSRSDLEKLPSDLTKLLGGNGPPE